MNGRRSISFDLVDESITRLDAKIAEFDGKIREHAERTVNLLGFDDSPQGERMRRHQMKCFAELLRGVQAYRKVRRVVAGGGEWGEALGGGERVRVAGDGWWVAGGG